MDAATISSAITAFDVARKAVTGLLRGKINIEVQRQVQEVLDKLGAAQDGLFRLRDDLFSLQQENQSLRQQLEDVQRWDERKSEYALIATPGGAVVHETSRVPSHYACPSCIESRSIQILQDNHVRVGTFSCPACKAQYHIKPPKPKPRRKIRPSSLGFEG